MCNSSRDWPEREGLPGGLVHRGNFLDGTRSLSAGPAWGVRCLVWARRAPRSWLTSRPRIWRTSPTSCGCCPSRAQRRRLLGTCCLALYSQATITAWQAFITTNSAVHFLLAFHHTCPPLPLPYLPLPLLLAHYHTHLPYLLSTILRNILFHTV